MGLAHVADWLAANPDIQQFAILYGTNDSWGVQTAVSANLTKFTSNMTAIVEMIIAAGRVPILARIPYASMAHEQLAPFNAAIDEISTSHGLPCGPDLYTWFKDHPEELSTDGVHPSDIGYRSLNRLWATAMQGLYPAN
jgi:lysophospholipase L1-like esterase